jgi:hypothetical protein
MEDEITGGVRERSRSSRASGKRAGRGGGDEAERIGRRDEQVVDPISNAVEDGRIRRWRG